MLIKEILDAFWIWIIVMNRLSLALALTDTSESTRLNRTRCDQYGAWFLERNDVYMRIPQFNEISSSSHTTISWTDMNNGYYVANLDSSNLRLCDFENVQKQSTISKSMLRMQLLSWATSPQNAAFVFDVSAFAPIPETSKLIVLSVDARPKNQLRDFPDAGIHCKIAGVSFTLVTTGCAWNDVKSRITEMHFLKSVCAKQRGSTETSKGLLFA